MALLEGEPNLLNKVLFVDDLNGRYLGSKSLLENLLNEKVVVITDARDIPGLLKQSAGEGGLPAFIVSNLQRAGIDGLNLAEQIRALGIQKASSIRIYLLTEGEPSETNQRRAVTLGVNILKTKDLIPNQETPQE